MSYDLHAKLADEFGGNKNWGYRPVETLVSCPRASAQQLTCSPSTLTRRAKRNVVLLSSGFPMA